MKIATPGKLPAARITRKRESEPPKQKRTRQERKAAREKKITGEIRDCAPASARQQLKVCRQGLGMRHFRIYLLALPVLAGLFLLLYQECGWTFMPLAERTEIWLPPVILVLSALLAWDVFFAAVRDLFHLRIGLHTLTVIITILAAAEALRPEG